MTAKRVFVSAAAVVLETVDGGERYFYGGAVLDVSQFTAVSIEHALDAGLVEPVTPVKSEPAANAESESEAEPELAAEPAKASTGKGSRSK
ncbi:hypothetical protein [Leucobacter sp. OH1287]|uniref:hypothetical protein n=1 Tax=Leucobacter sp. OH1287 TaxID=2491049 RepID=UPI000F5FC371|nr:hypothetical protein [Leucobacter sp. OH1287]RRD61635.1 hypothetical protein EII30_02065 [Leucobacter sp. OH1287]